MVHIGDHIQLVIYEGINQICFLSGILRHKDYHCPNSTSLRPSENSVPIPNPSKSPELSKLHTPPKPSNSIIDLGPGPWMVVHRKRPTLPPILNNNPPKVSHTLVPEPKLKQK